MTEIAKESDSQTKSPGQSGFRSIPSISALLQELQTASIAPVYLTQLLRTEVDQLRREIALGHSLGRDEVLRRCRAAIDAITSDRLDPVINGTGVLLHTNLGRAPVSRATADAMAGAARSFVSLELDPQRNQRGGRMEEVSRLMRVLTGAEATLVVNNNAAAVLLTLAALCRSREVIVSRGEAVEIGGGFRIPEVIEQSGCRIVEVGTTNRTYAADFADAVTQASAALLKIHPSNFRVEGFTAIVQTADLAPIAARHGIPLIEDLGSGALLDADRFGLKHEPMVEEALRAGASIVTFSGDKLLGGPQAGLIAGDAKLVERIGRHPLARALRADKSTIAGIVATLRHYLAGNAESEIPIWLMISATKDELERRARAIAAPLALGLLSSSASIGGGSLPGETLPSVALILPAEDPDNFARQLRTGSPRIFPIIRDGRVLVDMRAVLPEQDEMLAGVLRGVVA